jgi:hypothetical protein
VWVGTAQGVVACYDLDGVCHWLDVPRPDEELAAGPGGGDLLLVDGRLVVGGGGRCRAFDAVTGRIRWETATGEVTGPAASPVALTLEGNCRAVVQGGRLLRLADGVPLADDLGSTSHRPVTDGSATVYLADRERMGSLRAVRLRLTGDRAEARAEVRWCRDSLGAILAAPVYRHHLVYCRTAAGIIAVDAVNGGIRQRVAAPSREAGVLVTAGGRLLDHRDDGATVIFGISELGLARLGENRLFAEGDAPVIVVDDAPGTCPPAAPVIANGQLLLRTGDRLYCVAAPSPAGRATADLPVAEMDRLVRAGIEDLPFLTEALADPRPLLRLSALRRLAVIGIPARAAGLAVARLLADPVREVRQEACTAIDAIDADHGEVVPVLVASLTAGEQPPAAEGLRTLGFFGTAAVPGRELMAAAFRDGEMEQIYWSGWALGRAGDDDAGLIALAATRLDNAGTPTPIALASARLLLGAGEPGVAAFVRVARQAPARGHEKTLASALHDTGRRHVGRLLGHLAGKDQEGAVRCLGWLSDRPVEPLRRILRQSGDPRRIGACKAVQHIGEPAAAAWEDLLPLGEERDHALMAAATDALVALAPCRRPQVLALLAAGSPRCRQAVAIAGRARLAEALPLMLAMLAGDDAVLRLEVVRHLGNYRQDALPALPRLLQLLDAEEHPWDVVRTLAAFGPDAAPAVPKVRPLLAATDANLRKIAAEFMRAVGPEAQPAAGELIALLGDARFDICRPAYDALCHLNLDADQIAAVLPHARAGRPEAIRLLGRLGPAAAAAAPVLQGLVEHDDKRIRQLAVEALKAVTATP